MRTGSARVTAQSSLAPGGRGGFTLVEMLVVIGLIVALVAGAAVALSGRGSDGAALANSQAMVSSLIGAARAQAALNQTNALLVIHAQQPPVGDAAKYLRALIVVREEPFGSGQYVAVGNPVLLPTPVCVVPPSPVPGNHLNTGVTWNNNAATGPVSTLRQRAGFAYRGQGATGAGNQYFGTTGSGPVYTLEFDPTGAVTSNTSAAPTKIALTTAVLSSNALPKFNNASAVRGIFVRKSGAVSFVNDATSF